MVDTLDITKDTEEKKEQVLPVSPAPSSSIIDRAEEINRKLEENIKKQEDLVNRQELIAAKLMLGGKSEAGQITKTEEQLIEEQAEKEAAEIAKRFRR